MFGLMTKKEAQKRVDAMFAMVMECTEIMQEWEEYVPKEKAKEAVLRIDKVAAVEAAKLGITWESPIK